MITLFSCSSILRSLSYLFFNFFLDSTFIGKGSEFLFIYEILSRCECFLFSGPDICTYNILCHCPYAWISLYKKRMYSPIITMSECKFSLSCLPSLCYSVSSLGYCQLSTFHAFLGMHLQVTCIFVTIAVFLQNSSVWFPIIHLRVFRSSRVIPH